MARLRTIFFVLGCLTAPATLAANGPTLNVGLASATRFVAPAARLPDLIDAVLRYSPPTAVAKGVGTPKPFEPLHWTAITDDADVIEELLARGADPNARDSDGRTPLMVAAAFDSRSVAEVLLAWGADPLARDFVDSNSALDFAAMAGHVDFASLLISLGAPVDGRASRNGETPLHYAAFYGRRKLIELFVAKGADVNAVDYSGVRPLQYARKRLQGLAVEQLLRLGARLDNLHDAVNAGDVARVQTLIAQGADPNADDLSGTALHLAAATGQTWIAAMFIDAGADVEAVQEPGSARPLHLASIGNHKIMAKLLIDRGANLEAREAQGRTGLSVAAIYGSIEVAKILVLRGADIMAGDVYLDTPLHLAAVSGKVEMADLLLSRGLDVNLRGGRSGEPPLHCAAATGSLEMVKFLIDRGADVNMRDKTGRSVLGAAIGNSIARRNVLALLKGLGAVP